MTLKTRLTVLLVLVISFLITAPYLALYSLGYRIDFENKKIVATGGIYVRTQPSGANIVIDDKISNTMGIFSNSVFVQNLLPKGHRVFISKEGYYDYQKELAVEEKEVTKLENVILFSKNIPFETLLGPDSKAELAARQTKAQFLSLKQSLPERFIIKNGDLYYSDSKENLQIPAEQKKLFVLKKAAAFKASGNEIIWLGQDGFLKKSDLNGKNTEQISQIALKIISKRPYSIEVFSQNIFLKENSSLLLFDRETKSFKEFYGPVKELKLSPDGQKIIYFNDNEIFVYYLNNLPAGLKNNALLAKLPEKIGDVYWLNSDYIIFNSADKIFVSETDSRGNINTMPLPETLILTDGKNIKVKMPDIFFDQQNKRLYVLTQNQLTFSDKILP